MSNAKKARRKRRLRKIRRVCLILIGVVFVGWIFYLGATWGPRPVDSGTARAVEAGNPELVEQSLELERRFEAIAKYRTPTEEELDLLREALDLQREYNLSERVSVKDRNRRTALEERLGHFLAMELHKQSLEAERESEALLAEGSTVEAVGKLREAYELQRKVNVQHGRSEFGDRLREARLEQRLASMEAAPLHERSLALEEEADLAIAEFRWEDARELLSESRRLQRDINRAERRSAYYNPNRIQVLDGKIASLQVGLKMSEVKEFAARAKAFEEDGRWTEAAQAYERAMILQNEINRDHPQSAFVSREDAIAYDAARQTALSAPEGERLVATVEEMRTSLREGNFGVVASLAKEASELAASISAQFSRSRYVTPELRLELGYLSMAAPVVPDLQNLLREGLVAMPGDSDSMISGQVSQKVFSRIMNANPSQTLGETLPVDSVSLKQAREFCRRASWILGEPVHLPEKAVVEGLLATAPSDFQWLGADDIGTWLSDTGEDGSAWAFGGFGDVSEEEMFQRISDNTRREFTIGLRYVVGS